MNSPFISNLFDFWITPMLVVEWKIMSIAIIHTYEGENWWTSIILGITQGNINKYFSSIGDFQSGWTFFSLLF